MENHTDLPYYISIAGITPSWTIAMYLIEKGSDVIEVETIN